MANYVRCILFSNQSGSKEGVIFTEDMDKISAELIPADCAVSSESEIRLSDLPDGFPVEYLLKRTSFYDF